MLFICGQSFVSGGELVLRSLLQNLKSGEVQYLICKDEPEIRGFFALPNTKVIPFKYFIPLSDLKRKFGFGAYPVKLACNILFVFFLLNVIFKFRPKVIISNNFSEMPFSIISHIFKIPFVQYVHEIIDGNGRVVRVTKLFQKYINKFICVSKSSQSSVRDVLKIDKTVLLYNSTDLYREIMAKQMKADPIKFLFIGMLNPNKDPMKFLGWLKLLSLKYRVSAEVIYHIFDLDLLLTAKEFCEANDLQVNWVFRASASEVKEAISAATFVCISSKKEALSLVALQALSLGTPVITTENGGVQELIRDNFNGFVIQEDFQIVPKLETLLEERRYSELSANCLRESTKYSHELHSEKFAKIIADLKVIPQSLR
jgi:glycosyltransferase involved in cell wall biosynthesis